MPTKTITVSVDASVERKFRQIAKTTHGQKKGYLGKAFTDAMVMWTQDKERNDRVTKSLQLLDQGFHLGGLKYKTREELHER